MTKTLFATDLDGTFLDADARVSDYTARSFNSLVGMGAYITFVTARTPATIEPIMQSLSPSIPAVCMTGAAWWDFTTGSYTRMCYHRANDVNLILQICASTSVIPFVYTLERGSNQLSAYHSTAALTPEEQKFVFERTISPLKTFHIGTPAPADTRPDTVLLFAMGEPDSIRRTAFAIREHTRCYASWYPDTYNPGLALLEVFAEGVSKATGLLELKLAIGADRIVAFGDNLNDIPMLQVADVAVAVENAHPKVKEIADVVIGPNTSNSVINYIMHSALC